MTLSNPLGLEALKVIAGEIASLGGRMVSVSVAVTMALKSGIDAHNEALLRKTEEMEGCPHIEMIDGWTQPFTDMNAHLARKGGVAWKNGDGNPLWYYHSQDDYNPKKFVRGYRGTKVKSFSQPLKKFNCKRCIEAHRR